MTRRVLILALFLGLTVPPAWAGELQKTLTGRWRGAWVVVIPEVTSDCAGLYTNNRISGDLASGGGSWRFPPGELAQIKKVDLKKSRLDLHLDLVEPVLVSYQDGPFTLYQERSCQVELLISLPRDLVRSQDVKGIEARVRRILERYISRDAAMESAAWNRRERDPYPEDYEETLAAHAIWQAEQHNLRVQARMDAATDEAAAILQRVQIGHAYRDGFATGILTLRDLRLPSCDAWLDSTFAGCRVRLPENDLAREWQTGYFDGQRLVYALAVARHLRNCFVPVPEP